MKLAITSEKEILDLNRLLTEIEELYKYELRHKNFDKINFDQFEILKNLSVDDPVNFLDDICKLIHEHHFQRVLWNCDVMLKNCADLSLDHLDYSPEIKRGFEAVELLKEMNECLSEEREISSYKEKITELLNKKIFE